jgi:hypothetical protein
MVQGGSNHGGVMRGGFRDQAGLFSYIAPERRIPAEYPLRPIRGLVRDTLKEMRHSFGRIARRAGGEGE